MDQLPREILLQVFGYLDPDELDIVRSTSRFLYGLIDEEFWRTFFCLKHASNQGSIPRIHSSWRRECILRWRARDDISRRRGKKVPIDPKIGRVDTISYDVETHQITIASKDSCHGQALDAITGNVLACGELTPGRAHSLHEMCLIKAFPSGIVSGFINGGVALTTLDPSSGAWETKPFTARHYAAVTVCALSGDLLVTGDERGELRSWSIKTRRLLSSVQSSLQSIQAMYFGDDKLLAFDRDFGRETISDTFSSFGGVDSGLTDPNKLFGLDRHVAIEIYNMPNMTRKTLGHLGKKVSLWDDCFHLHGQRILIVDQSHVSVQDFSIKGHPLIDCERSSKRRTGAMAFSPPDVHRRFAVASDCDKIDIYDFAAPKKPILTCAVREAELYNGTNVPYVSAMALSKTILAAGREDGSVLAYDALTGETLRPIFERVWKRFGGRFDENEGKPVVKDIFLHPYLARGVVNYRYEIVCFSLVSDNSVQAKAKKARAGGAR